MSKCRLCGEPMPSGEEMFYYHGFSSNCPKPPLSKDVEQILSLSEAELAAELAKDGETIESASAKARAIFERALARS